MKSKNLAAIMLTFFIFYAYVGYGQKSAIYSGIDTENVLSYKVDEIIVMRFGGSSTHYNVSDLRLISKVDLGPGNIRIITPVYKDGMPNKKYYIELMTPQKGRAKKRKENTVFEISTEDNQIRIQNNPKGDPLEKEALLQILKKMVPINELPYSKPQIKEINKKIAANRSVGAKTADNDRLATQKANRALEYVSLVKLVPNKEQITKTNDNIGEDNLKKSKIEIRPEREVKLKVFNERIGNAKLISTKAQENRRKKSDSTFLARKEASIKESRIKSQKEIKNGNREKAKSRKAGEIKVAEEGYDLTRVRYDKTKYNASIEDVTDSLKINSLADSLDRLERKKMDLSAKSLKINKLRNSKSIDTKIKQDGKVDIAANSRNNTLKNKQEIKANIASLDSSKNKSNRTKYSKESDEKKEVMPKLLELVSEVSKIKAVTTDSLISQNAINLNSGNVFLLSDMTPKSSVKIDQVPSGQNSVVIDVVKVYERVANKGYKSVDLYQKIADSYFFKGDMETAVVWYEKLFDLTNKLGSVYYFRFATALRKVGKTEKGDNVIENLNQLKK